MNKFISYLLLIFSLSVFAPALVSADEAMEKPAEIININQADAETLTELKGIGESKASAIVEWREENGPFESPEDLLAVNGIGDATLEDIESRISFN